MTYPFLRNKSIASADRVDRLAMISKQSNHRTALIDLQTSANNPIEENFVAYCDYCESAKQIKMNNPFFLQLEWQIYREHENVFNNPSKDVRLCDLFFKGLQYTFHYVIPFPLELY